MYNPKKNSMAQGSWLQVPEAHITQVVPRANLQAGEVALHVHGSQAAEAREVVAVVSSEGADPAQISEDDVHVSLCRLGLGRGN